MDKSFICLVSCKPYDDLKAVVQGIKVLKNEEKSGLRIDPYLALVDFDQISDEDRGSFSEITIGTSVQPISVTSLFAKGVEAEILKDKKAQFVFVGEEETIGATNNTEAIGDKIRSSILAGLPVILGLNAHDNADQLKGKLLRYLSDLSDEQRETVTLVYQSRTALRLELHVIQDALSACRAVLKEVCGESLAERMKILYSIPKFTPELLKKCLIDQIDGVCIRPGTLPVGEKTAEINAPKRHMTKPKPKAELQKEEKPVPEPVEEIVKQEIETETRDVDASKFLSRNKRRQECLIFCHSYDDVEKTIEGLKELAEAAGRSDQTEWLFALPFSFTSEIASFPQVSCGSWNLSFANTKLLTEDVHFSILKERGASFVVLGDRMGRAHLNLSDGEINRLLHKALKNDLSVVIGLTHQNNYREQLQNLLEGIEPEDLQSVRLLFYAGLLGQSFDHEAAGIAARMQSLLEAVHSLYGEEGSSKIKILIEISHYSEDPFAYLSHRSVDGISLSASATKSELIKKLTRKISLENKPGPVVETTIDEPEAPESVEKPENEEDVSEFEQEESAPEEEEKKYEAKDVEDMEDVEEKVSKAPVAAVKEFTAGDTSMTEEEMEEWEKSHSDGESQEGVEVEFVESEERREEVIEEEKPDAVSEPAEEAAVSPGRNAATVAEGLQLVKLTVDECAERLAEKNFQETYIPNDMELESPEVKLERLKREYKRMFDDFRDRSSEGWEVLFRELKAKNHPQRESIVKALNLPLEKIMEFTEVNEVDEEEGKAWFEVIGLSKDQMDALYEIAKGLYEKKKYKESAEAFFTLVSLNAKEYGMWFGYGMAKKMENKDLETALNAFSMANSLNAGKPDPYIHAAECYLAQGNTSEAERCLKHGKKLISADAEHAAMKEWADYLTNQLNGGHL